MTKYFSLIIFTTHLLQAADHCEPNVEIIQAIQKPKSFPSLKKLAAQTAVQHMQKIAKTGSDDEWKKHLEAYEKLPTELQALLQKELPKNRIDVLKPLIRIDDPDNSPDDGISMTHKMNKAGTMMIYSDPGNTGRLHVIDFTTGHKTFFEHEAFVQKPLEFNYPKPYFMDDNSILITMEGSGNRLFEYIPKTGELTQVGHVPSSTTDILCWLPDKNSLALVTNFTLWKRFLINEDESFYMSGRFCGMENYYAIRNFCDNRFTCHNLLQHTRVFAGDGEAIGIKSSLVYAKNKVNDQSTIDIWSVENKTLVRRIMLDACLNNCKVIEIKKNAKMLFSIIDKVNVSCTSYLLDSNTGLYRDVSPKCKEPRYTNIGPRPDWGPSYQKCFITLKSKKLWVDGKEIGFNIQERPSQEITVSENMQTIMINLFPNGFCVYSTDPRLQHDNNDIISQRLKMLFPAQPK